MDPDQKNEAGGTLPASEEGAVTENVTVVAEDSETKTEDINLSQKTRKDRSQQPYINPDRVKTGGQREKMTPEELAEKLEKIRLQNVAIKQRQQQVDADKQAFSQSIEIERQKAAQQAEIQVRVNRSREANARRKQERRENREWDVGKDSSQWSQGPRITTSKLESGGRGRAARESGRDSQRHNQDENSRLESSTVAQSSDDGGNIPK